MYFSTRNLSCFLFLSESYIFGKKSTSAIIYVYKLMLYVPLIKLSMWFKIGYIK